jgi:hypothetical protein
MLSYAMFLEKSKSFSDICTIYAFFADFSDILECRICRAERLCEPFYLPAAPKGAKKARSRFSQPRASLYFKKNMCL